MGSDYELYLENPYRKIFSQIKLYPYFLKYILPNSNGSIKIAVIEQTQGIYGEDILSKYTEDELRKYWKAFLELNRNFVVGTPRKGIENDCGVYLKEVMGRPILGSNLILDVIVAVAQMWERGIGIATYQFILSDEYKEIPENERARREVEFIESDGKTPLF